MRGLAAGEGPVAAGVCGRRRQHVRAAPASAGAFRGRSTRPALPLIQGLMATAGYARRGKAADKGAGGAVQGRRSFAAHLLRAHGHPAGTRAARDRGTCAPAPSTLLGAQLALRELHCSLRLSVCRLRGLAWLCGSRCRCEKTLLSFEKAAEAGGARQEKKRRANGARPGAHHILDPSATRRRVHAPAPRRPQLHMAAQSRVKPRGQRSAAAGPLRAAGACLAARSAARPRAPAVHTHAWHAKLSRPRQSLALFAPNPPNRSCCGRGRRRAAQPGKQCVCTLQDPAELGMRAAGWPPGGIAQGVALCPSRLG